MQCSYYVQYFDMKPIDRSVLSVVLGVLRLVLVGLSVGRSGRLFAPWQASA